MAPSAHLSGEPVQTVPQVGYRLVARRLLGRILTKPPAARDKSLESGARDQHEPACPRDHTRTCGAICA